MQAVDTMTGALQPLGVTLAVVIAFLVSFFTPRLLGRRRQMLPAQELPPGIRPRRQWLLSGLSLTLSLLIPLALLGSGDPRLRAAALVAALAGFVGVTNDILGLPRLAQAMLGIGIAGLAVSLGIVIEEIKPPFTPHMIPLGNWSAPVSMIWLLAVSYGVVLCRRLPGLTAGLMFFISLTLALAALLVGPSRSAPSAGLLGLILTAAAAGASRRGYPSLGGSAHWVLGFALGTITILGMLKNTAFLVLGVPLLALAVPVGETTYAIIYGGDRGREKLAFGQRRELLHEALIRMGLSPHRTALLFQAATADLCALALVLALLVKVTFLVKLMILVIGLMVAFITFFCLARIMAEPIPKRSEQELERVDMLGVPIARIDMEGALARVEQFVGERSPHMIVTSDSTGIVRAQDDLEFQEIVREADLVTADGRGVVWMARVLGLPVAQRVSGVDLTERICELAARQGYSVFLLGAGLGVAEEVAAVLKKRYPGLRVAGMQHGYFTAEEEPEVVRKIAAAKPDILFVAFGAPKQEKWIRKHLEATGASVAIGVGGTLDVLAGRVKRAPRWMQQAGLEWLYRALREPKRVLRLWALPRLVGMTLWEAWRRRG